MRDLKPGRILTSMIFAGMVTGVLAAGATESPGTQESSWEEWRSLVYKTRAALFIKGRVDMSFVQQSGGLSFQTDTRAKFLGATLARERTNAVLDPETGLTREYSSLTPKRGRHYIFNEDSYTLNKLKPTQGFEAPLEQWEVTSSAIHPYPVRDDLGSNQVHVSYNMLSHLRTAGLDKPGDETTIYVATSSGPERYRVKVGESRMTRRPVIDLDTGDRRYTNVREFRLDVSPVNEEKAKEFLGLKGKIEIWVEAETKTLLRISGNIPRVPGRVVVDLIGIGNKVKPSPQPG